MELSTTATASDGRPAVRDARASALERNDVREAVRVVVPIALLVTIASTILFGGRSPALVEVGGAVVLALVLVWRLGEGPLRRRPHVVAFVLVTVILAGRLLPMYFDLGKPYLADAYFGFIVVASAVFLPWSGRWHAAWLTVAGSAYAFTLFAIPAMAENRMQSIVFAATALLVSMAGNSLVRRRRRRTMSAELNLREQGAALREAQALLQVAAHEDPLTGLSNRRRLNEDITVLEARSARGMAGVAAVMVDLDSFKEYNDFVGHPTADRALRATAAATRNAVRAVDRVYRYGGEEFLVLLEDGSADVALATAERIARAVRELRYPHPGTSAGVLTVSAGVAASEGRLVGPWAMIDEADRALYGAKDAGRDQAVAYTVQPAQGRADEVAAVPRALSTMGRSSPPAAVAARASPRSPALPRARPLASARQS